MYSCGSESSNSYATNLVNKILDQQSISASAYIGLILSVIGIPVKSCIGAPLILEKQIHVGLYIKVVQSLCVEILYSTLMTDLRMWSSRRFRLQTFHCIPKNLKMSEGTHKKLAHLLENL